MVPVYRRGIAWVNENVNIVMALGGYKLLQGLEELRNVHIAKGEIILKKKEVTND